ncbi:hypothetical protein TNCV_4843421 [Trichonephila clavipes]|uniref:Uncharacterized protein n=1 Tax=Trichonephila clavipes TaxID=2585209 RepID=A0A8X7BLV1_TRICX|nr:hypothetical protein TNCV_4843421 [Trichonephila clavipes]
MWNANLFSSGSRHSSFANPTPLAHADASRGVLPRVETSQATRNGVSVLLKLTASLRKESATDSLPSNLPP